MEKMDSKASINSVDVIDESICTVIILRYKVYRNDSGKIFGKLLTLKHKVDSFLKEVFSEEMLFQNPTLQRTRQGLIELIQGLSYLCSGITPTGEVLTVPELSLQETASKETSYEMKFVKEISPSDLWLCYIDNGEFLCLLKRLREKYDKDELQPFIFYPRIGEHVYFRQGANIFRGVVLEYVIPDDCKEDEKDEMDVDVKVLNIDNSDIVVLPQNCFFQLDEEGTKLPMQCVLCTLQNVEKDLISNTNISPPELSFGLLQKHKLNVTFHRKKVPIEGSPLDAQCVSINVNGDKNGVFVTKNSENATQMRPCDCLSNENNIPTSDQSFPTPSDIIEEKDISIENKTVSCDKIKSSHKNNDINEIVAMINTAHIEEKLDKDKDKSQKDMKVTKFDKSKVKFSERHKDSSLDDLPVSNFRLKPANMVASTNLPYHYSPGPPFPTAPMHFTGPCMPFPATQHMNPPAPYHYPQYPYAPYIPLAAMPIPSQPTGIQPSYFLPPSSVPSQPAYPPQFYPAPPSQMPQNWFPIQPSFRISSPSLVNMPGGKVEVNTLNVNKSK